MLGSSDYKRIPEPSRLSRSAGSLGSALANRCLHSDCWNGLIGLDQDEDRGKSLLLLLLSRLVVSDSVRRQRRQPTRLPRPWDSPGMNTGGGCHCPLSERAGDLAKYTEPQATHRALTWCPAPVWSQQRRPQTLRGYSSGSRAQVGLWPR